MPDGSKFCSGCGTPTTAPASTPTPKPAPPPVHRAQTPSKSHFVQLTPEEQDALVFQDGDYFEVIGGILSISSQRTGSHQNTRLEVTQVKFFFESSNPEWGTQEWTATFAGSVPEGPALLVLYKRGNIANVFGVVSMVNRAWTHIVPILGASLIASSTKAAELKQLAMKSMAAAFGGAAAAAAVSKLTLGLGQKKMTEKFAGKIGVGSYKEVGQQIEATTRSFMFRIAQNANQYWNDGGNSTSGKL